jgi:hypothetical protein
MMNNDTATCPHDKMFGPLDALAIQDERNYESRALLCLFGIIPSSPDEDPSFLLHHNGRHADELSAIALFPDEGTCQPEQSEWVEFYLNVLSCERQIYDSFKDPDDVLGHAGRQQDLIDWRRATIDNMESSSGDVLTQIQIIVAAICDSCHCFDGCRPCTALVEYGARIFVWLWLVRRHPRPCPPELEQRAQQALQWFEEQHQKLIAGAGPELLKEYDEALRRMQQHPTDSSFDSFLAVTAKIESTKRKALVGPAATGLPFQLAKPDIVVTNQFLHKITERALATLEVQNDPEKVCVRAGQLARLPRDEAGRLTIQSHTEFSLRGVLDRAANWLRRDGNRLKPSPPPFGVIKDIQALGAWNLPRLDGIITTPVLRDDGTILQEPGLDTVTHLYYDASPTCSIPPVPAHPTPQDVQNATQLILDDLIVDFPFEDQSSLANFVAALATPIVRPAIDGCIPMACFDKPRAGTGATYLTQIISRITSGRPMEATAIPADDVEMNKVITSCLLQGFPLIFFDNIERPLHFPSLEAALTSESWRGRRLGQSEMVELTMSAVFYATGNNLAQGGDLPRRTYWIRLDAKVSQPWKRKGFKHPNLLQWVDQSRPQLVHALLTICRAWFADGRPAVTVPPLGGFEEWTSMIGGILSHAGITGFLGNADHFYQRVDEVPVEMELFLSTWHRLRGDEPFTTSELIRALDEGDALSETAPTVITEALVGTGHHTRTAANRLGKVLRKYAGTIFGEYRLEREGTDPTKKVARWTVRELR